MRAVAYATLIVIELENIAFLTAGYFVGLYLH